MTMSAIDNVMEEVIEREMFPWAISIMFWR
jgi:hypothetical protein